MYHFIIVLTLLCATASAYANSCIDCHTSEVAMKKMVVVKAAGGEEGVG